MMQSRDEIGNILNKDLIGCELGVFRGDFSKILLESNKFKKLYLVDPFIGNIESGDKNGNNVRYFLGDSLFNFVSNEFKEKENIEIKRICSVEFLKSFPDNYFDFIYIDSSHEYTHTQKELNESYRVIKKNGGIISGHDYDQLAFAGVFNAVNEFAATHNLNILTTKNDALASFFLLM